MNTSAFNVSGLPSAEAFNFLRLSFTIFLFGVYTSVATSSSSFSLSLPSFVSDLSILVAPDYSRLNSLSL